MLIINDILISLDLLDQHFACDYLKCKGACCVEGEGGAPLAKDEVSIVESVLPIVKPLLSHKSQQRIKTKGFFYKKEEGEELAVTLMPDGACAFLIQDSGFNKCAFELAYEKGLTQFQKPISCHLYPIRVLNDEESNFEALNYDRWDICQSACTKGSKNGIKIYEFCKTALTRKYGADFYEELDAAAKYLGEQE